MEPQGRSGLSQRPRQSGAFALPSKGLFTSVEKRGCRFRNYFLFSSFSVEKFVDYFRKAGAEN
jgi:hypothetical protein